MSTICYAITVKDEIDEIKKLIPLLEENIREDDEILIQYDSDGVSKQVLDYLNDLKSDLISVINFPLNKDFASFKNNLASFTSKDFIFQIDADELPHLTLFELLPNILEKNDIDIYHVPRINTVEGLTDNHIKKWGWRVDSKDRVNWPDWQQRIYRNIETIKWINKVHERLDGFESYGFLPEQEEFALVHPKSIDRQERQNNFYETL